MRSLCACGLLVLIQIEYMVLAAGMIGHTTLNRTIKERLFEIKIYKYVYADFVVHQILRIFYSNFNSFHHVANLTDLDLQQFTHINGYDVLFSPNDAPVLDTVVPLGYFESLVSVQRILHINLRFFYLSGVDVNLKALNLDSTRLGGTKLVTFFYSSFRPFDKKRDVNTREACEELLSRLPDSRVGFFRSLTTVSLSQGSRFVKNTCKYVFANADLGNVNIFGLSDCFTVRNVLGFMGASNASRLKSRIVLLQLYLYEIKLDPSLLSEDVFEQTRTIKVEGSLDRIEPTAFEMLTNLKLINFKIENVHRLFARASNAWLRAINRHVRVNLSNLTDVLLNMRRAMVIKTSSSFDYVYLAEKVNLFPAYSYPDEDFCLFVPHPFENLVFLDPQMNCWSKNCSCTQYWLLRDVELILKSNLVQYVNQYEYGVNLKNYDLELKKCRFHERVARCDRSKFDQLSLKSVAELNENILDQIYRSQVVDFTTIILIPTLCIVGIVTNAFNIKVIASIKLDKATEDYKQKTLIKFMLVYSIVNLAYCVIHLLYLMNKCVHDNGVFCSTVYRSYFAQYYRMIGVEFVGNSLKSLSNFVYLGISLNRYILLEKDSKLAKFAQNKVSKWRTRTKIILTIITTIVLFSLNTHKLLVYKVIDYRDFFTTFNLGQQDYFLTFPMFIANSESYINTEDASDSTSAKSNVYLAFVCVNFFLIELLVFVAFTVFDILLVVSVRQSLKAKKSIISKLVLSITNVNEQLNDIEQTELNIMRAIIANTVVLFVFKLFELAMTVSKFLVWKKPFLYTNAISTTHGFCFTLKICLIYEDLVKLLTLIVYSYTTILYLYLNKNFRVNFQLLFERRDVKQKRLKLKR